MEHILNHYESDLGGFVATFDTTSTVQIALVDFINLGEPC